MSSQDTKKRENFILKSGRKKLDLSKPAVMGILNVTPDSFYDGNSNSDAEKLLKKAEQYILEGAKVLDLGAISSRPGSVDPGEEEELRRLLPALRLLRSTFPDVFVSVDTYRSTVALAAAECGADMINDIYAGLFDHTMFEVVAECNLPYVMMHMKGNPSSMQKKPRFTNVLSEVKDFFSIRIKMAKKQGVKQIIIDPGFGFGKTVSHNYTLLKGLKSFNTFSLPVLSGLSRKSMVNKVIGSTPESALNGTTVLNVFALQNGASLLRVHDVKEAMEAIKIVEFYKSV